MPSHWVRRLLCIAPHIVLLQPNSVFVAKICRECLCLKIHKVHKHRLKSKNASESKNLNESVESRQ